MNGSESTAQGSASGERKPRVVIVTYYWPPSGGAGVQRWLKMAKSMARHGGVEPIIFTPANPDPPLRDESLLADVPEAMQVETYPSREPSRALRKLLRKERGSVETTSATQGGKGGIAKKIALCVRANIFIPDARCFSIRIAAKRLQHWIETKGADAIITTGPPHSMHLVGLLIKRAMGLPWIADFRDPWVDFPYLHYLPLTRRARRRHAELERRVVMGADRVVVVSPTMRRNFEETYSRNVDLIYNGYDEDDFATLPHHISSRPFTLLHCGEMKGDQSPHALWQAIAELHREGIIAPDTLRVELIGRAASSVMEEVQAAGIESYVAALPPVSHSQLPALLQQAGALLLCINRVPSAKGIITGKLFEYLAAQRPILAFGPTDGDTASIISQLRAGAMYDHSDSASAKQTLTAWMAAECQGELAGASEEHAKFSRQEEARAVERIVEELLRRERK